MDRNLAWQMIRTAYKCSAEMQALLQALKESCPVDEYRGHARAIAASIDTLNVQLVERALTAHPELKRRLQSEIEHFGRLAD